MGIYHVTVPIAGAIVIEVDADNKPQAIQKALEVEWIKNIEPADGVECLELNTYKKLFEGNVSHVDYSEAEAQRVDTEDDDDD